MAVICPTITVNSKQDYDKQMSNVSSFIERLHIDLMDGVLAPTKSIAISEVSWPDNIVSDVHLMYQKPMDYLDQLVKLRPNMVIFHAEADVDHAHFAIHLKDNGIKAGLAILQETPLDKVTDIASTFDQILVFGGHLGYQGGQADLGQLNKVREIKMSYPGIEIAWDGGVNDQNAKELVSAGVDVLNVGGFIQHSTDPKAAYDKILASIS